MTYRYSGVAVALVLASQGLVYAKDNALSGPEAAGRTYLQNYKDMVLATCISDAYKGDKTAPADAGSSVSALRDWTYFDMDKSPDEIKALIDQFLNRNYTNPLAEGEAKGVKFDFLKCLDLYHSKELDDQAKKYVIKPTHTYRQDSKAKSNP